MQTTSPLWATAPVSAPCTPPSNVFPKLQTRGPLIAIPAQPVAGFSPSGFEPNSNYLPQSTTQRMKRQLVPVYKTPAHSCSAVKNGLSIDSRLASGNHPPVSTPASDQLVAISRLLTPARPPSTRPTESPTS